MVRAPMNKLVLLVPFTSALLLAACSGDHTGSAAPGASGAPASSGAAQAPAAAGGKTIHQKLVQGECTFEFDAPEQLKQTAKDGVSTTLSSDNYEFVGFEGAQLHSQNEHPLDSMKDRFKEVYRNGPKGENGVQVAVLIDTKPSDPPGNHDISGAGGEPYSNDRNLGCRFSCDGIRTKQAEVIAFCKSVKIAVAPEKK